MRAHPQYGGQTNSGQNNSGKNDIGRNRSNDQSKQRSNVSFNTGTLGPELKNVWIADSGATSHMRNSKHWFSKLHLLETPIQASIGDGTTVEVTGIGSVKIESTIGDYGLVATLKNVQLIPELAANLFSVGSAANNNYVTVFNKDVCYVKDDDEILAVGKRQHNSLYVLQFSKPPELAAAFITRNCRDFTEWHEVLGHPGPKRLA